MAPRTDRPNNLFGVDFDGISFGSSRRESAGDFVPSPAIDLTSIAATLAAGPGPQPQCYNSIANPGPLRQSSASLRKRRPHREEHVKRTRISYNALGAQDPIIPPYAVLFPAAPAQQQPPATDSRVTKAKGIQSVITGYGVFIRILEVVGIMREMLFRNGSHV